MAASILFKDGFEVSNVPEIEDVDKILNLLKELGISHKQLRKNKYYLDTTKINSSDLDEQLSKKMRASIILTGPLLARFGKVSFPYPGGCVIGERPLDIFLEAFEKMGVKVSVKNNRYQIKVKGKKLKGAEIFFRKNISVTATETLMMTGVLAEGKTVLKNVAMEPEIVDLANFLIKCGAKIKGAGTSTIEIIGGPLLSAKGKVYETMPDRLEAGSFLILGALCAKDLEITNCNPEHLESLIETMKSSGVKMKLTKNSIKLEGNNKKNDQFKSLDIKTHEYPGFPTDLQSPFTVFLTQARGEALVHETIFEGRLNYVQDLIGMGAKIDIWDSLRVTVHGPAKLKGRKLHGPDIRTGFAFIIAALVAEGESVIDNIYYIDRGYEKVEERLQKIGVDIQRIN
jgi:UDP-N-acetylglucosamine 1-carboxyvinyltransferase